jgi:hypothetical protein
MAAIEVLRAMISHRSLQANRTNAKRSTGPRTAKGKARASRNALSHGLAISIARQDALRAEVDQLVQAILESYGSGTDLELATRVAEAQVDLNRVHRARQRLLSDAARERPPADNWREALSGRLDDKTLRIMLSDHSTGMQIAREILKEYSFEIPPELPEEREARALIEHIRQLTAFDRYERRALSRRKFAIRALDAAATTHPRDRDTSKQR